MNETTQSKKDYTKYENCRLWEKVQFKRCLGGHSRERDYELEVNGIQEKITYGNQKFSLSNTKIYTYEVYEVIEKLFENLSLEDKQSLADEMAFYQQNKVVSKLHLLNFIHTAHKQQYKDYFFKKIKINVKKIKEIDSKYGYVSFSAQVFFGEKRVDCFIEVSEKDWVDVTFVTENNNARKVDSVDFFIPFIRSMKGQEVIDLNIYNNGAQRLALLEIVREAVSSTEEYRLLTMFD